MKQIKTSILFALLLGFISVNAITPGPESDGLDEKGSSGIDISQTSSKIIFSSHARSFEKMTIFLVDDQGDVVFAQNMPVEKDHDYFINIDKLPPGYYLLKLGYNNRLIISNLQLKSED
ncbi:MAG: hypothetical protein RIE58_04745 [Vicingaceae bacterium]